MRNILYVAHPNLIETTQRELNELGAKRLHLIRKRVSFELAGDSFPILLHLIPEIDEIVPHLQEYPVDLMVYDERDGGLDAVEAVREIDRQVSKLATEWGPDFHFPMGRIIAIIERTEDAGDRMFELGRDNLRNVLINPQSFQKILKWVDQHFHEDHTQNAAIVGIACSGGGLDGFLYQIGCVYALEQALSKRSIYDSQLFSGVSSGSIIAALLATKIPAHEVVASFFGKSSKLPELSSRNIYDLAGLDILSRIKRQTTSFANLTPTRWFQSVLKSIPTGFFRGDGIQQYLADAIQIFGVEDSFRGLAAQLFIGATDQDSYHHVIFGDEPFMDAKISEAVRASCALPPVFTPITIGDRHYIDGQITRTCHLENLVKGGANLIFIIDPLKPYSSNVVGSTEEMGGIFTLIQSIKTLVYTRFKGIMGHLTERYPGVDFIVLQPSGKVEELMLGSPMRYRIHRHIIKHAYIGTLQQLRERNHVYAHKLAKYGFELLEPVKLLELERSGFEF